MPKLKLTKTSVDRLKAPDHSGTLKKPNKSGEQVHNPVFYWDTELPGFGVMCSGVKNSKTYIAQRDIPGGAKGKLITRRVKIGDAKVLTADEARKIAGGILHEMWKGIDPRAKPEPVETGELTLRGALDAYLAARKTLRPASIKNYRLAIEHSLAKWLDLPLRDITAKMVEERHREIAAEIKAAAKHEAQTGEAAANAAMRTLRVLWNFAEERVAERGDALPPNPVLRLRKQWYEEATRERVVEPKAMPAFYAALQNMPSAIISDYLTLILFTGLRRAEAASLTWEDIDFEARLIRLPAARTKGKRKLDLPMTDIVFDLLKAREKLGRDKFVFPGNSASGHIEEPRFALNAACAEAGIKLMVHDLRRTFITEAEASEISWLAVKKLVNHAPSKDVTARYAQLSPERLREALQSLNSTAWVPIGFGKPVSFTRPLYAPT